jgi:hypothetical protein
MDIAGIAEAVALAERRWPGLTFRNKDRHEATSPCPFCRDGDDRFHVFEDGGYWCRVCDAKGWIDDDKRKPTEAERTEMRLRALERHRMNQEKRLSALEQMHRCTDHLTYHKMLDTDDREYWHSQGIYDGAIDRYTLGICYACPTDREHRPSYTIPIVNQGKLCNIRHRIIDAKDGDKYRPHMAGLGNTLFNADNLYRPDLDTITIVEGEKKSICLSQYDIPTVGTFGARGFEPHWAKRFERFRRVYVAFDPGAELEAEQLAALFDGRGYVVDLPCKPDDFFVMGGKPDVFKEFLGWARRIKRGNV